MLYAICPRPYEIKRFINFLIYNYNTMAETEKKRGALLTIWLVIMLIANFFTALFYLLLNPTIASADPNVASWIFYIYGISGLANFAFVIFLFMWKRWAFYALCGSAMIVFIMNLAIGVGIFAAIFGLAEPVILYLIMKSNWDLFE